MKGGGSGVAWFLICCLLIRPCHAALGGPGAASRSAAGGEPSAPAPRGLATDGLKKVVARAEFRDMTLDEFAEWLGRTTGANVIVRWKALDKAGLPRDRTFSLKEKKLRIKDILPRVFRALAPPGSGFELAAEADDNTLIISTRENLESRMVTRHYEVQDLLHAIPDFSGVKLNDPNIGSGRQRALGLREGGALKNESPETQSVVNKLIDVITRTVRPPSWKVNGGKGTISYFRGRLIIHNSIAVQTEIAALLKGPPHIKLKN